MNIRNTNERMVLDAYLDKELSAEEAQQFEQRLQKDPELRRALKAEQQFRAALRAHVKQTRAPAAFRTQIDELIKSSPSAEENKPSHSWWEQIRAWLQSPASVPRWALAMYTIVILLLVGGGTWISRNVAPPQEKHTVFRKLGGKHIVYTTPSPVLDVTGTPQEVTVWFQSRAPWPVRVPQFPGWHLVGGRLGEFHHQPMIYLLYERNDRYVALMLFAAREDDFPPNARRHINGKEVYVGSAWDHPILLWREGEVGYALVGDTRQSTDELLALFQTLGS